MAGIYLHIPFCKRRCSYCAFYSSTGSGFQERYVKALCREIEKRRLYIIGNIETIYLGGGTPTTLSHHQLKTIIDTIKDNYNIMPDAEITIEANPDDLSYDKLLELKSLPFNRLSIGIQSFNDRQLERLGRRHTAQQAREAVMNAKKAGFTNISIDLMFALPSSNNKEWQEDLENAISLSPTHISAYNLTYEEGTPLYKAMQEGNITPLNEDGNLEQFETLISKLEKAGYQQYEISNFAIPGYESRHNSSYWHDIPYIGCGAAAHSYNGKSRQWNIADIEMYCKGIEKDKPCYDIEYLTLEEQYNDALLTRLRTKEGVPLGWLKDKFGNKLYDFMISSAQPHIKSGKLLIGNNHLFLSRDGIFISDAIIRDLIYVD